MPPSTFHISGRTIRHQTHHYLAVPIETYQTFFQSRFARLAHERHQLKLIVYDPTTEEISQWIN